MQPRAIAAPCSVGGSDKYLVSSGGEIGRQDGVWHIDFVKCYCRRGCGFLMSVGCVVWCVNALQCCCTIVADVDCALMVYERLEFKPAEDSASVSLK